MFDGAADPVSYARGPLNRAHADVFARARGAPANGSGGIDGMKRHQIHRTLTRAFRKVTSAFRGSARDISGSARNLAPGALGALRLRLFYRTRGCRGVLVIARGALIPRGLGPCTARNGHSNQQTAHTHPRLFDARQREAVPGGNARNCGQCC